MSLKFAQRGQPGTQVAFASKDLARCNTIVYKGTGISWIGDVRIYVGVDFEWAVQSIANRHTYSVPLHSMRLGH